MPVHRIPGGWQWGSSGKVYRNKAAAKRQAQAIFASGYREDARSRAAAHRALSASRRAESRYVLDVLRVMGRVHATVLRDLAPGRRDAQDDRLLRRLFALTRQPVQQAFDFMADEVDAGSARGAALVGIRPRSVPGLDAAIAAARERNVRLIQSATEDFVRQVRDVLEENEGADGEAIANALQERVDVSKSRATTIARDQTLKLNASLTEHRQRAAGVSSFRWSSSKDERVRPGHRALDGRVFSWDEGLPADVADEVDEDEGVTPGEPVNCRCVAIPMLGVLGGEAQGEEEPDEDEEALSAAAE